MAQGCNCLYVSPTNCSMPTSPIRRRATSLFVLSAGTYLYSLSCIMSFNCTYPEVLQHLCSMVTGLDDADAEVALTRVVLVCIKLSEQG